MLGGNVNESFFKIYDFTRPSFKENRKIILIYKANQARVLRFGIIHTLDIPTSNVSSRFLICTSLFYRAHFNLFTLLSFLLIISPNLLSRSCTLEYSLVLVGSLSLILKMESFVRVWATFLIYWDSSFIPSSVLFLSFCKVSTALNKPACKPVTFPSRLSNCCLHDFCVFHYVTGSTQAPTLCRIWLYTRAEQWKLRLCLSCTRVSLLPV